jgi:bacillithiol biosynthesis deacetylase BshB2
MKEKILLVFPHPDDENFVAGTVLMQRQKGIEVSYLCLTRGEMGRSMGNPLIANRETTPVIRTKELEEACRILGINELRWLGYHDKTLEFEDEELLADRICQVIREIQPTRVYSFYPGFGVHPDHDATGAAVVRAIKQLTTASRPVLYAVAFAPNSEQVLGPPDVVQDVSEVAGQKLKAMLAHQSQGFQQWADKYAAQHPEAMKRLHTERFWLYRF